MQSIESLKGSKISHFILYPVRNFLLETSAWLHSTRHLDDHQVFPNTGNAITLSMLYYKDKKFCEIVGSGSRTKIIFETCHNEILDIELGQ